MNHTYYSHGKLLLTSEYIVLDGAQALALPTKKGQSLTVIETVTSGLHWKSVLEDGSVWVDIHFSLPLKNESKFQGAVETKLFSILKKATELNPDFLKGGCGFLVTSTLEFPRNWGLGSSSTLITNIAQWAKVNPYDLLEGTFGGSGYDIACAAAQGPIIYSNRAPIPSVKPVIFEPSFKDELFFVHLNKKQNSRESIKQYRSLNDLQLEKQVHYFSLLTQKLLGSKKLSEFEDGIEEHEAHLSGLLKTPTIKTQLFMDYPKTIKSLGGWGGDFILATGTSNDKEYFYTKGFKTVISYEDMILS